MLKVQFLKSMHNLADERAEKEIRNWTSFMNFLGFPGICRIPRSSLMIHVILSMKNPGGGKEPQIQGRNFTRKNSKTFFGFKGHTVLGDNKDHDSTIDLSKRGITVYRDRAARGHNLLIESVIQIQRVRVKFMFTCFAYNLRAVKTIQG